MLIELIALASFLIILTLTWKSFCIEDRIHEIEAGLDDLQVDIRNLHGGILRLIAIVPESNKRSSSTKSKGRRETTQPVVASISSSLIEAAGQKNGPTWRSRIDDAGTAEELRASAVRSLPFRELETGIDQVDGLCAKLITLCPPPEATPLLGEVSKGETVRS